MSPAVEAILAELLVETGPAGALFLLADLIRQLDPSAVRTRWAAERLEALARGAAADRDAADFMLAAAEERARHDQ